MKLDWPPKTCLTVITAILPTYFNIPTTVEEGFQVFTDVRQPFLHSYTNTVHNPDLHLRRIYRSVGKDWPSKDFKMGGQIKK
jgi:hypothetical protein